MQRIPNHLLTAPLLTLAASACGSDDAAEGTLTIRVQAEEVIVDGLAAGNDDEDIQDGWDVTFERYVAVLGNVRVRPSTGSGETVLDEQVALDLASVPEAGVELGTLEGLAPGRYEFGFEMPIADEGATADQSVEQSLLAALIDDGDTYSIAGTLSATDGRSCPPAGYADVPAGAMAGGENDAGDTCYENPSVDFEIVARAAVSFGPCEVDGVPGVNVREGGDTPATITIHGDHLFFNGFPEGAESTVVRRAQFLADCDLNLDGEVTEAELKAIPIGALSELDSERYQLGSAPITLNTVWDYLRAQLMTQGHFQGEGECPYAPIE